MLSIMSCQQPMGSKNANIINLKPSEDAPSRFFKYSRTSIERTAFVLRKGVIRYKEVHICKGFHHRILRNEVS